ncbi:MAG: GNAT family N-acetyltransferase, partial [Candidatus Hydromicrobium sp.]
MIKNMEIKINKKTYNIRNYNEQDYDAVMNIHFKELDNVGVLVRENVLDVDLDNINKYYFLNNGAFIIIEDEGKIIAIGGLLKINSRCAEIKRMRVKYEYQRSG